MDKTFDSNTEKTTRVRVKNETLSWLKLNSLEINQEILAIAIEIYFRFVFERVQNPPQKFQNHVKT